MGILLLLLESFYFFLPVYIALFVPVMVRGLSLGNTAVSVKWFGKNKTWRGAIAMIVIALVVFLAQKSLYIQKISEEIVVIDYAGFSLFYGLLLGIGVVMGDLWKSYAKRKESIREGEPWFMMDYFAPVLGALILSFFMYVPSIEKAIFVLLWGMAIQFVIEKIMKK